MQHSVSSVTGDRVLVECIEGTIGNGKSQLTTSFSLCPFNLLLILRMFGQSFGGIVVAGQLDLPFGYDRFLSAFCAKIFLARLTRAGLESVVSEVTRPLDEDDEVNRNPCTKRDSSYFPTMSI